MFLVPNGYDGSGLQLENTLQFSSFPLVSQRNNSVETDNGCYSFENIIIRLFLDFVREKCRWITPLTQEDAKR